MPLRNVLRRHRRSLLAACAVLLLSMGCGSSAPAPRPAGPSPAPTPPPPGGPATPVRGQSLRIVNSGPSVARNLTVVFPDSQVLFGDVQAGETTPHRDVANGVYRYAAYRLEIDGELVSQPVIDWVGERPMEGIAFTYTIDVDSRRPRYQWVRLLSVSRD